MLNESRVHVTGSFRVNIEKMIISMPLTYVPLNKHSQESSTLNHLFFGDSSGIKPIGNMTDYPEILRKKWKRQQLLSQYSSQKWTSEYLPKISNRTRWNDKVDLLTSEWRSQLFDPKVLAAYSSHRNNEKLRWQHTTSKSENQFRRAEKTSVFAVLVRNSERLCPLS